MKRLFLSLTVFFLAMGVALAQRTITGTVTGDDGEALIGASVRVQGTNRGPITDIDGRYSVEVPNGATAISVTYTGFETKEITLGTSNVVDITMAAGVLLDEAVVTALGVSRDKKSLGYATQQVDGEEVANMKQQNFVNSLSGRVAGMQIRQNNNFGGSTNVVIRGNNSLLGNNQALFVVDGVPVSNYQGNSKDQRNGRYGYDYGNAVSDINPNDIEKIDVLKGAAATALYGSRGSNGVVMITTKKGSKKKGIGVTLTSSINVGHIDKNTFIKYQNQYGAGYGPYYGPNEDAYFNEADINDDGVSDFVVPTTEDGSYGAPFDPNLKVYQWSSFVPESPNYGKALPWVAAQHTPVDFFETQLSNNNSIAFDGSNENGFFRLGYTNFNDKGIMPNSKLDKHNISFNSAYNFTEKLTASIVGNYVHQDVLGRNSTGYSDNLMSQFRQWWQTNVDIKEQQDIYNLTGRNVTWNMRNPIGGDLNPIYWDNPYWTRFENYQTDNRDRIFGNVALNYKINSWLSVLGRVTTDRFNELREQRRAVGSVPLNFGLQQNDEGSGYQMETIQFHENNYDLMFNYNHRFNDLISLSGVVGTNVRQESTFKVIQSTTGGLAVPGLYAISNSKNTTPFPDESLKKKQVNGYYGSASLGFKDTYYLELSDRYDISSTLPTGNNAYNYYSASGSVVFSQFLQNSSKLSFGKVRLGYAEVGNDTEPLNVNDTYLRRDNNGSSVLTSIPDTKNNPDLRPERTKSLEAGLEMKFFTNRLGLDISVYKNNTVDQILPVSVSRSTGYSFRYVNAGELQNKGIEVGLTAAPIRTRDFSWDLGVNWSRNRNTVVDLYQGVENVEMNSYQGGVTLNATKGELYGTLRGTGYEYLNGQRVVTSSGYYKAVADRVIGVAQPDWMAGITNRFTYKGVSLSSLVDISQGGDVYSLDMHYGQGTGLPEHTAANGVRENGVLFEGVTADGAQNTKVAPASSYGGAFYWGNASRNPSSMTVYDASYIKLREVALAYNIPTRLISGFSTGASLSVYGRNLLMKKHLPYADPEAGLSSGNAQGYISGALPTVRSYGASIKISL